MTTDHPPQPVAMLCEGPHGNWLTFDTTEETRRIYEENGAKVTPLFEHPAGHADRAIERATLMSEQVEQAAKESGFKQMRSCCNVPQKFCSSDVWQGELRAFGAALLRIVGASAHPSTAHSGAPQPQRNDHVDVFLGAVSPDRQAGDRASEDK